MRKHRLLITVLSLCLCFSTFGFTGCSENKANVRVWSTYNTRKVMQSFGEYEDLGVKLDVLMAKGETEGAQLLITPDKRVNSAVLTAAELTDGNGNKIGTDSIKVYMQKYIDVQNKTPDQNNEEYPTGYTPDMLLPMQTAVDYGETSVEAGHNQGFTVEFTTTSDTAPGTYTGTFSLNVDGQTTPVPVSVEVRDIDITVTHGKTMIGALGSTGVVGEFNNGEMYKTYFETAMNDYKFTFGTLPGAADVDETVESVLRYWDNPHFSSYAIPYYSYGDKYGQMKVGEMYSYIYALAKASTPDKILLSRAYVYAISLDEPTVDRYDSVRRSVELFYEIEDKVYNDLCKEGFFDGKDASFREAMHTSITHIPFVQTAEPDQVNLFGTACNTYCSKIDKFDTVAGRNMYAEMKEANRDRGGETWFYTCMYPVYPYPSHHLDDYLIGSRIMRWMQKDYGLDGYLHWSFDSYYAHQKNEPAHIIDPYTEDQRFPGTEGDGFMIYPGKKYGLNTFLPSLRLTTYRDGQEDYDLLCVLEDKLREKEKFFSLGEGTVSLDAYVSDLYDAIYSGTVYNSDDKVFYDTRKALMDIIEAQDDAAKYLLVNEVDNVKAVSKVYVANGYTVTIDGTSPAATAAGEGVCYSVTNTLEHEVSHEIVVYYDGEEVDRHTVFVSPAFRSVSIGEGGALFKTLDDCSVTYDGGEANVTLRPREGASTLFRPYVRIAGGDILPDNISTIDTAYVTVTNTGDKAITLGTRMYGSYAIDIAKYEIAAGESVTIRTEELWKYAETFGSLINSYLEIYIDNAGGEVNFAVTGLQYSLRRA